MDEAAVARFWAKVDRADGDGCWVWAGYLTRYGYGQVWWARRREPAHRVAWELENGPIPGRLVACHKCDNRPCVRPSHLFLGTRQDNNADMLAKGRQARGRAYPQAKLTEDDVRAIRRGLAEGRTNNELGATFGVDPSAIRQIARGVAWSHVR